MTRNVLEHFESNTMFGLYNLMDKWDKIHDKFQIISFSVQKEDRPTEIIFSCIMLAERI